MPCSGHPRSRRGRGEGRTRVGGAGRRSARRVAVHPAEIPGGGRSTGHQGGRRRRRLLTRRHVGGSGRAQSPPSLRWGPSGHRRHRRAPSTHSPAAASRHRTPAPWLVPGTGPFAYGDDRSESDRALVTGPIDDRLRWFRPAYRRVAASLSPANRRARGWTVTRNWHAAPACHENDARTFLPVRASRPPVLQAKHVESVGAPRSGETLPLAALARQGLERLGVATRSGDCCRQVLALRSRTLAAGTTAGARC